jgi:hypothetical protein
MAAVDPTHGRVIVDEHVNVTISKEDHELLRSAQKFVIKNSKMVMVYAIVVTILFLYYWNLSGKPPKTDTFATGGDLLGRRYRNGCWGNRPLWWYGNADAGNGGSMDRQLTARQMAPFFPNLSGTERHQYARNVGPRDSPIQRGNRRGKGNTSTTNADGSSAGNAGAGKESFSVPGFMSGSGDAYKYNGSFLDAPNNSISGMAHCSGGESEDWDKEAVGLFGTLVQIGAIDMRSPDSSELDFLSQPNKLQKLLSDSDYVNLAKGALS